MSADQIEFTRFGGVFMNSHDPDDQGLRVTQVQVTQVSGGPQNANAFVYQCLLVEDNDGAPNCYGLNSDQHCDANRDGTPHCVNLFAPGPDRQSGLTPLERHPDQFSGLAHASRGDGLLTGHTEWVGLFAATPQEAAANGWLLDTRAKLKSTRPDRTGVVGKFPVVKRDPPFAGFYISTTGQPAAGGSPNEWDQSHHIDAAAVPYAVWANQWEDSNSRVGLGDSGLAINTNTGASSEFKFLDTGTVDHVGECSRKLCRTLVPTPETIAVPTYRDPVSFIAFPNSRSGGGVSAEIAKLAAADNADELILFLALGADLGAFKAWLRRFYSAADFTGVRLPAKYWVFFTALGQKGYPVDQIPFHGVEQSINLP